MKHPSSLDLEAFACGEVTESIGAHLGECAACHAFVERLRDALHAGPSRSGARDAVARAAARTGKEYATSFPAREAARRGWRMTAGSVAVPLALAAALLLLFRTPSTRDVFVPASPASFDPPATSDPEMRFKGGIQVAVIRDRAGYQRRFTEIVTVKPGDRLRVEVALDREQTIIAAVMGDDASWLELMAEGLRQPGTHFSEKSARVDTSPMRGTILVGSPEAVAHARSTHRFEGLAALRIEWEAP